MKKSDLKAIIAECARTILAEMRIRQQPSSFTEDREETFYQDAQGHESDAKNARHNLEVIKQAGLEREYEALMNGIFKLPIQEFDKRALAIDLLTKKAYQMVGNPLRETSTTSGGGGGYNIPGFLAPPGKGGSPRGVEGSPEGYSLTTIGKTDMKRGRDALLESIVGALKENIGTGALVRPTDTLPESQQMNPELIQATWEDDKDGEYVQINPDGSVYYVAHGNAMEQIAPKGTGKDAFRRIGSWMKMNNLHLNIWEVNDHGNIELFNNSGRSLGGLV